MRGGSCCAMMLLCMHGNDLRFPAAFLPHCIILLLLVTSAFANFLCRAMQTSTQKTGTCVHLYPESLHRHARRLQDGQDGAVRCTLQPQERRCCVFVQPRRAVIMQRTHTALRTVRQLRRGFSFNTAECNMLLSLRNANRWRGAVWLQSDNSVVSRNDVPVFFRAKATVLMPHSPFGVSFRHRC